jgi:hypothetical protein
MTKGELFNFQQYKKKGEGQRGRRNFFFSLVLEMRQMHICSVLTLLSVQAAALPFGFGSSSISSTSPWFCHGIECPGFTLVRK